eukprot:9488932-Pyramimonas_sp.AAC.1
MEKLKLDSTSRGMVVAARAAIDSLQAFVTFATKKVKVQDLTAALLTRAEVGEEVFHFAEFDGLQATQWVARLTAWSKHVIETCGKHWGEAMRGLAVSIRGNLIEWESKADTILAPSNNTFVRSLLENKGYQQLTPLAIALTSMIKEAKDLNRGDADAPVISPDTIKAAADERRAALVLVSLTFTLYTIKVEWPKIRGYKQQETARLALESAHSKSAFGDSWDCLPVSIKNYVQSFGAIQTSSGPK